MHHPAGGKRRKAAQVTAITARRGQSVYCRRVGVRVADEGFRLHTHGGAVPVGSNPGEGVMLWTIFVILLVLWLLGMVSSYTMGGFIHVLLVVAVVVALIQLIQGRKVV